MNAAVVPCAANAAMGASRSTAPRVAVVGLDPRACEEGREHGDADAQPRLLDERPAPAVVFVLASIPATFVDEDERLIPQRRHASKDVADCAFRLPFAQVAERGRRRPP